MTRRNWGSVRIPVSVPTAGAFAALRKPEVIRLSLVDGGRVPGLNPKEPGLSGSTESGPGKTPDGLAAEPEPSGEPKDGADPPWRPIPPFLINVLPRNQSKPKALLSCWVISANFASIVT